MFDEYVNRGEDFVSNGQLHTFTHNLYEIIYCKKLFKIHIHIAVVQLTIRHENVASWRRSGDWKRIVVFKLKCDIWSNCRHLSPRAFLSVSCWHRAVLTLPIRSDAGWFVASDYVVALGVGLMRDERKRSHLWLSDILVPGLQLEGQTAPGFLHPGIQTRKAANVDDIREEDKK